MSVMDFTIDVGILMIGSGIGNPDFGGSCKRLMNKIKVTNNWCLALDKRNRIRHQYETKMKHGTFGHHWLREMATNNKIVLMPWRCIDRGTKTALKEEHFDKEDFKYIETAAETKCKHLLSHDPDYSTKICKILKRRLSVVVVCARDCL